jgi:hypothetical protein
MKIAEPTVKPEEWQHNTGQMFVLASYPATDLRQTAAEQDSFRAIAPVPARVAGSSDA